MKDMTLFINSVANPPCGRRQIAQINAGKLALPVYSMYLWDIDDGLTASKENGYRGNLPKIRWVKYKEHPTIQNRRKGIDDT